MLTIFSPLQRKKTPHRLIICAKVLFVKNPPHKVGFSRWMYNLRLALYISDKFIDPPVNFSYLLLIHLPLENHAHMSWMNVKEKTC